MPWPASPLSSRERRLVRVRVWGRRRRRRRRTGASRGRGGRTARAGRLGRPAGRGRTRAARGRRRPRPCCCAASSTCRRRSVSARLYATRARRLRDWSSTAQRVGDHVLAPGLDQLPPPAALPDLRRHRPAARRARTPSAAGWPTAGTAAGSASAAGAGPSTATAPALLAQLEIRCADGSTDRRHHRRTAGAPRPARSCPPASTTASATTPAANQPGWSSPGFDDSAWARRRCRSRSSRAGWWRPTARRCGAPSGSGRWRSARRRPGRTIVDFGQNLTGRLRIRVRGEPGQVVRLRHAEVLRGRRAVCPAAARRPRRPTSTRCAAAAWRSGSRASPSTASGTPR